MKAEAEEEAEEVEIQDFLNTLKEEGVDVGKAVLVDAVVCELLSGRWNKGISISIATPSRSRSGGRRRVRGEMETMGRECKWTGVVTCMFAGLVAGVVPLF